MPVGTLHERHLASAPERERAQPELEAYKTLSVERRSVVKAGDRLTLRQAPGAAPLRFEILGADAEFVAPEKTADNAACRGQSARDPDPSDNRHSVVSLVSFGPFRFFDGGDLTWAAEAELACPQDRVGPVDLYQTNHHGSDSSNNPVLLRTLRPSVVVVNNGAAQGRRGRNASGDRLAEERPRGLPAAPEPARGRGQHRRRPHRQRGGRLRRLLHQGVRRPRGALVHCVGTPHRAPSELCDAWALTWVLTLAIPVRVCYRIRALVGRCSGVAERAAHGGRLLLFVIAQVDDAARHEA
jgi:hypothetical protein